MFINLSAMENPRGWGVKTKKNSVGEKDIFWNKHITRVMTEMSLAKFTGIICSNLKTTNALEKNMNFSFPLGQVPLKFYFPWQVLVCSFYLFSWHKTRLIHCLTGK